MSRKSLTELKTTEDFVGVVLLVVLGLFFLTGLWYVVIKGIVG
jgi:hypothetical protein